MTADTAPGAPRHSSSRMLRLPGVAAMLGLSESTVRRAAVAGDIPFKRIGKIVLIPESWVAEFTAYEGEAS